MKLISKIWFKCCFLFILCSSGIEIFRFFLPIENYTYFCLFPKKTIFLDFLRYFDSSTLYSISIRSFLMTPKIVSFKIIKAVIVWIFSESLSQWKNYQPLFCEFMHIIIDLGALLVFSSIFVNVSTMDSVCVWKVLNILLSFLRFFFK